MEQVVLVDERDEDIGVMNKLEAHEKGLLHRAFSILLFDTRGNMLLQKRALNKYHSPGLWTNTCCSHPRPEEPVEEAVNRRLREEMGIDVPLHFRYKFIYKANLGNLIEHEYDHVYTGTFDGKPDINPEEVSDWKFVPPGEILEDMKSNPGRYTAWFRMIIHKLPAHIK